MQRRTSCALLGAALVLGIGSAGCRTGQNYLAPEGPRYSGPGASAAPARLHGDTLTIATFNIENGLRIDSALVVFQTTPELRDLDVVMLQEVDEPATQRIANALRMAYVYYPAMLRKNIGRDWGNAVLTRWPIIADAKLVLPHIGKLAKTMRSATAVTLEVGDTPVRVYSTHLGTIWNVTGAGRRSQLRAILKDADKYDRVIIAGDMNSSSVGKIAVDAGYAWPTHGLPKSIKFGSIDHVFLKGLAAPAQYPAATVSNNHHASDHRPVWAKAILR